MRSMLIWGGTLGEIKPTYFTLVKGVEGITGVIMVICMVIAFTLATRWFRRSLVKLPKPFMFICSLLCIWHSLFMVSGYTYFMSGTEKRWDFTYLSSFSLHETIEVWVLRYVFLIQTWMYLAVPVCLYVGERVLRFFRSGSYSIRRWWISTGRWWMRLKTHLESCPICMCFYTTAML